MNDILWVPSKESISETHIYNLKKYINQKFNLKLNSYDDLHRWSINNIELFWSIMWVILDVVYSKKYS